jgi:8-oxo-dGTP pyrophosphatase MutT (NUDIX family)
LPLQSARVRAKALVWILRSGAEGPQVLLLERPQRRGGGEHPVTGKSEKEETPAVCAARESWEETGLRGELIDLRYAHRYRGKRGDFREHAFLLRAADDATPQLSDEHQAYRWASPAEARTSLRWRAHLHALDLALKAFASRPGDKA